MNKLIVLFFLFLSFPVGAQNRNIKWTILDFVDNEPLPFVNLYLKKGNIGKTTDFNGNVFFSENEIQEDDTVVISFVGYVSQHILIRSNTMSDTSILLVSSNKLLNQIDVVYTDPIPAKEIVKNAINNCAKNYTNQDAILNCFYRETVKEEETYIQLNEAFTAIYYTGYPQSDMDHKIWYNWHDNEEYTFDIGGNVYQIDLLHDFNTKRDKMKIIESRSSLNWSKYDIEWAIMGGGPLALTALDKLKYAYDFLNPNLLHKYEFDRAGVTEIDGVACYVINFVPKPYRRSFSIDQSSKNKFPIYAGQLFIEKNTFAVAKFKYQLAVDRDFGFFSGKIPLASEIEVAYRKTEGSWNLHKISVSEVEGLNTAWFNVSKKVEKKLYSITRELFVESVEKENVLPFPDSLILKSTRFTAIRYVRRPYQANYWLKHQREIPSINEKIISDLEQEEVLESQFYKRFQKRKNLPQPLAKKERFTFNYHNEEIVDSLHWMAYDSAAFRTYLKEENEYAKNYLIENRGYQKKLFNRMKMFYPKNEEEETHKKGDYFLDTDSLNQDVLYYFKDAETRVASFNLTYFKKKRGNIFISDMVANPVDSHLLVFYEKPEAKSQFISILRVGDSTVIEEMDSIYSCVWLSDSTYLYSKVNTANRSDKLWFHQVGENERNDLLIYHELDIQFDVVVDKRENQFYCSLQSISENEEYLINTEKAKPTLHLISPRELNVFYEVGGKPGDWYMYTNDNAPNHKILHAKTQFPIVWKDAVRHKKKRNILAYEITENYVIIKAYHKSILKVFYKKKNKRRWREIKFDKTIKNVFMSKAKEKQDGLYLWETNPSTPNKKYLFDCTTGKKTLVKEEKVIGYSHYATHAKRLWARSKDGVKIPITLIRNPASIRDHKGVVLKAYGMYGSIIDANFSMEETILLEQGYSIAYAHIRGGGILGQKWHEKGKLLHKKNTFNDYIACAQYLIKENITTPEYLIGRGQSGGGLVVGWAANEYPELFNTIILDHAYLDVVNTMMNDSLPLTIDHYKEEGNPNEKRVYDYMKSYSPYQNIKKQDYPNMIFIAGYLDYQTPTWQIAKHVAKIRAYNTGESEILLLTDMLSGHKGSIYEDTRLKVTTSVYSFLKSSLFD